MLFGKTVNTLIVAASLAVGASSASAVPVTLTYDFTNANAQGNSLSFLQSGVGLTVTGYTYSAPDAINTNVQVNSQNQNGLGVCGTLLVGSLGDCGSPQLDGGSQNSTSNNEVLKFSFSSAVSLLSIEFNQNDTNDVLDFFFGEPLDFQFTFDTPNPGQRVYSFAEPYSLGLVFGVGVRDHSDQVRIAGLTVRYDTSVVPLPDAGILLIAALGSLAVLRRRRTI